VKRYYLDANGSTPALKEAQEKVAQSLKLCGNPSSFHEHGRLMRALLDEARFHVAKAVSAKEKELIFTSGASESNRLFVDAIIKKFANKKPKILCSPYEHPSLLKPLLLAHDRDLIELFIIKLEQGRLVLENLEKFDVIICCQAHNETGIIPDFNFNNLDPKTILMSDISQGFCRLDSPDERIDVLTFSAQKMGGFAGSGGIIFRGNAKSLESPWAGGGQEKGLRPGTEAWLLILAFLEASKYILRERKLNQDLKAIRDFFETKLKAQNNIKIIGEDLKRLPNTSAVVFVGADPDALRIGCDLAGLSVGFGSACSGLAPEGSFALKRLNLSLEEEKTTVRFSFCTNTSLEDIEEILKRLDFINHKSRV
jgi:cysteine desulfurase